MERLNYIARMEGRFSVTGAPEGFDAWLAAEAAERRKGLVLFVAADDVQAQAVMKRRYLREIYFACIAGMPNYKAGLLN